MNRISARFYLERQYDGPLPDEGVFSPVRSDRRVLERRRAQIEVRDYSINARRLIRWIRKGGDSRNSPELRKELRFLLRQRRRWKRHLRGLAG